MADSLELIFADLRERMLRSGNGMNVTQDELGNLVLRASWNEPGKKESAWFGAVQLKKNYVSWHLMPLYAAPSLCEKISPKLAKQMRKSCFNFKEQDSELFDALNG